MVKVRSVGVWALARGAYWLSGMFVAYRLQIIGTGGRSGVPKRTDCVSLACCASGEQEKSLFLIGDESERVRSLGARLFG